jgi:hypothetical protein
MKALAYYATDFIIAVKSLMTGPNVIKLFTDVIYEFS